MTEIRDEPYPLAEPEASLGELVGRVAGDMGVMIRDHIELAKEEITAEVKKAGTGAGLVGGGAVAAWTGVLLVSFAAAWALALALETWLAFLIVGLVWLGVAGIMALAGRKELSEMDPRPEQTMKEIEKDKQWLKEQTS
jgi:uncharacterized membrane protein YqjE